MLFGPVATFAAAWAIHPVESYRIEAAWVALLVLWSWALPFSFNGWILGPDLGTFRYELRSAGAGPVRSFLGALYRASTSPHSPIRAEMFAGKVGTALAAAVAVTATLHVT